MLQEDIDAVVEKDTLIIAGWTLTADGWIFPGAFMKPVEREDAMKINEIIQEWNDG